MVIGILQFELLIHGAESLKDKRRVVHSVKDRLHREHQVSVAEVGALDHPGVARLGLALVGGDGRRVAQVLDAISAKLRSLRDAELGDCSREILDSRAGGDGAGARDASLPGEEPVSGDPKSGREADAALALEMLARADAPDDSHRARPGARP